MAIMFHYFFLATFSWLMNEAFNLYIVITYAAHSHGDHEGGSQWRYYILGWSKYRSAIYSDDLVCHHILYMGLILKQYIVTCQEQESPASGPCAAAGDLWSIGLVIIAK